MPDYGDLAYSLAGYGRRPSPYETRRKYALQQLQAGSDTSPILSPWQGVGRLASALAGGLDMYMTDRDEKAADKKRSDALAQAMAEPDPQKRIGLIAAYDPDAGARAAGSLAVEQAKMKAQADALQTGAANFGAPYGGSGQGGPVQSASLAPLPTGEIPPGQFANNSGNIRSTAPGNAGGFATYPTPQAGANAHFANYQAYVRQNPNITVAQALAKWSPPNENNTQGIISRLAEETGINPGMPLAEVLQDPMVAARLLEAQTKLEKGGIPQGFTPDTFIAAAGGGQPGGPSPGVPGPIPTPPPQVAQGDAPPGMPPAPNPSQASGPAVVAPPGVPDVPRPQPSPQQIQQYQQRIRAGEFGQGQEAISKARAALDADLDRQWSVDRERAKAGYDQQFETYKHQRGLQDKKDNPTYTQEQNLSHTYATRLNNAIPQLEALIRNPDNIPSWAEQMRANSPYAPEFTVSAKAKEYRRIVKDIMSGTLRRESGATIKDDEYRAESEKFIPQPGDTPEIIKNKVAALKQAARSIAEGTGRPIGSYSFFSDSPAAGSMPPPSSAGIPPPPPGFRPLQ